MHTKKTRDGIAEKAKVSHQTVHRADKFAHAADILNQNVPGVLDKILQKNIRITQGDLIKIAQAEPEQKRVKKDKPEKWSENPTIKRTAHEMAKQQKVSRDTVHRAHKYAEAADVINQNVPGVLDKILQKDIRITQGEIIDIAREDLTPIERIEAYANWVDHLMCKDNEYAAIEQAPLNRLAYLLSKLYSDMTNKTDKFISKFTYKIDAAFKSLPESIEWVSFYTNDLKPYLKMDPDVNLLPLTGSIILPQ